MMFISKGIPEKGGITAHLRIVSGGQICTLFGLDEELWLRGRFDIAETTSPTEEQAIREKERLEAEIRQTRRRVEQAEIACSEAREAYRRGEGQLLQMKEHLTKQIDLKSPETAEADICRQIRLLEMELLELNESITVAEKKITDKRTAEKQIPEEERAVQTAEAEISR